MCSGAAEKSGCKRKKVNPYNKRRDITLKVRKYVVLIPAILIFFNSISFAAISGDANGDGKLDLADAIIILQTLVGLRPAVSPPTTPTGFIVIPTSSSQINLSWNASTGAITGYKMYRGGTYLKTVTTTSTSDTGLSASTNYCYYVTAYNSAGDAVKTSQLCATTQAETCNAVDIDGRWTTDGSSAGNAGVYFTQACNTFTFYINDPADPRERIGAGTISGSTFDLSWPEPYYNNIVTVHGTVSGNSMTWSSVSSDGSTRPLSLVRVSDALNAVGNWAGTVTGNYVCGNPVSGNWTITVDENFFAIMNMTLDGHQETQSFTVVGNSFSGTDSCTGCTGAPGTRNVSGLFSGNTFTLNLNGCGEVMNFSGTRQ
jgi:hypothetical protein